MPRTARELDVEQPARSQVVHKHDSEYAAATRRRSAPPTGTLRHERARRGSSFAMTYDRSFDEVLGDVRASPPGGQPEQRMDANAALAALATVDLRTADLPAVLQRVAELAQKCLPGADEASLSLI